MKNSIFLIAFLVWVVPFSGSPQDNVIEIRCQFARKENPFEKSLFGRERLRVVVEITNVSGDEILVPSPSSLGITGNPSLSVVAPSGDTLECLLKSTELIPVSSKFEEISFVKLPKGRILQVSTDVLEGCDFNFQNGKKYKIIAEFRSVYNGTIEIDGESCNIWNGRVTSKPISFGFVD